VVAGDPGIDALIVIYIPPLEASAAEVARQLVGAHRRRRRAHPGAVVLHVRTRPPRGAACAGHPDPFVPLPEQAAIALRARRSGTAHGVGRAEGRCRRSTTRSRGRPPR
jgi:acyl-CoA synthetase (NDP forming)